MSDTFPTTRSKTRQRRANLELSVAVDDGGSGAEVVSVDAQVARKKRPWNGILPKRKKKFGRRKKKSKPSWIEYKESLAAAAATATVVAEDQSDAFIEEQPEPSITIPAEAFLPPSKLRRTIASKIKALEREKALRLVAEEKAAKATEALKIARHELWRVRKASHALIEQGEGAELLAIANTMMQLQADVAEAGKHDFDLINPNKT